MAIDDTGSEVEESGIRTVQMNELKRTAKTTVNIQCVWISMDEFQATISLCSVRLLYELAAISIVFLKSSLT